ncbi:MAG: hypothetical protein JKY24_02415 [Pseudomonadales bacterium]|nr:hypothetical protein [Pseudomonadales bacterium]
MAPYKTNRYEVMKDELPIVFSARDGGDWLSKQYRSPMKALEAMVESGELIRLKRGQYAFSSDFDPLVGAQFIHYPSYLSFETALSYYGMIPERTNQYLSVVDGRPAKYNTPVGQYIYHGQNRKLFSIGMGLGFNGNSHFLIATREKALLDTLWRARLKFRNLENKAILDYVFEGLRVDFENLKKKPSLKKMKQMAPLYRNHAPRRFVEALEALK